MAANSQFAVALHTVAVLAYTQERWVKSSFIAQSVKTNPVVIRRILQKLARAKLVLGTPGKTGGTRLARAPERITLWDVYKAMEGKGIFAVHANPIEPSCAISTNIKGHLTGIFGRAEEAAGSVLETVTLAQFMKQFPKPEEWTTSRR